MNAIFAPLSISAPKMQYNHIMSNIALNVPPVNQRDRIPMVAIEDVIKQIAARLHPQRITLFDSYAYRQPYPESDVDLLVIIDTPMSRVKQAV